MVRLTIYRDTRAPEQYSSWIAIAEGVEGDDEGQARFWRRFDDGTSLSKTVQKISPPAEGWRDESNYFHITEEGLEIWDEDGKVSTAVAGKDIERRWLDDVADMMRPYLDRAQEGGEE